jgi:hypothetical protein
MKPRHLIPALAAAPAIYFFSFAPAMALAARYPQTFFMPVHAVHHPLFVLAYRSASFFRFLNWFIGPWMP